ncbi:equilibrative nucleotide transporter 1 [Phalaenopsis equestris]|uniref:equilibrative nucleotide transporter 1 n=1 Tax=Phalaenopsis equestris TaxID=78828 RepID=UPI0009E3BC8F|nr:equilibrative nucleotide transporter 1 [Phalaenopsis equestris]
MGFSDEEQRLLTPPKLNLDGDEESSAATRVATVVGAAPKDQFYIAYIVYFILGMGFLLPWNAFITAVDYFSYLYPGTPVDRVFSVAYMLSCLLPLIFIIGWAHLSSATVRINTGLVVFTVSLVVVPVLDAFYVRNTRGVYSAYDVTVAAVILSGIGSALVQGGVIGSAGELPEIYMQAVVSGTAASGVLVSAMRIICKAIYPQDATGLRHSANLYFAVTIAVMIICIICFNIADRLPVIQHYRSIKIQAMKEEGDSKFLTGSTWRSTLRNIFMRIKWYGFGLFLIYVVTLSIFPGYITEDVHSEVLKDWYPIILITGYNIFDFVGKAFSGVYLLQNDNVAVGACVARLLFYPLFFVCLHGPEFIRTETPVMILTCLLGLTNGYFTAVVMTLAPKSVPIQHAETAGIVMVLFLVVGLLVGSLVSWFWVL